MGTYRDDSRTLSFLYGTVPGRVILKGLTAPWLSRLAGRYMDSAFSVRHIRSFAAKNGIDLSLCRKREFDSFNDFFTRQLKPELRPVDMDPKALASPCDGRLSVFPIDEKAVFSIKGSHYTVRELLDGDPVAERYMGGQCLVFRLCVGDYHRYHYPDSGTKGENRYIPGVLHTVRPIALASVPVFTRNSREYTLLHTEHFGTIAQMEVGALLIGRIRNHHGPGPFRKGQEKGMFLYGGSTVVLLLEPGRIRVSEQFPADGEERQVLCGQRIGTAE